MQRDFRGPGGESPGGPTGGDGPFGGLARRLHSADATVGIIGLGYVGLPLARAISDAGFRTLGFDADSAKVRKLNASRSYIASVSDAEVARIRAAGFAATDRHDRLGECDCILICVPTPLTPAREPDLGPVVHAARQVAATLRPGQLVVLESTTYPTTTRGIVLPILEAGGLRAGADFALAYSPERENPGHREHSVARLPKVVGGFDPASRDAACAFYRHVAGAVVPVSSLEIAEAAKLLENTYRAVNIALVNEMKVLYDAMGIDIWEVIAAAETKPFGFQAFYPGPGLGGHCIPIDPFYLAWLARRHGLSARFIELAGEVNARMPAYAVERLAAALAGAGRPLAGSRILILGMAYKKDVDDPRESPGFELMKLLRDAGAAVDYNDPHIPVLPPMRKYAFAGLASTPLTAETLADRDAVVIAADHSAYDWAFVAAHARLVLDTRNALSNCRGSARVVRA